MFDKLVESAPDTILITHLTDVLVSKLDIRELLSAIAASIAELVPHDLATLTVRDPSTSAVRSLRLDSGYSEEEPAAVGGRVLIEANSSSPDWACTSGKAVILNQLDGERVSDRAIEVVRKAGMKSACYAALQGRRETLGAISVARCAEGAFTGRDADLLSAIACRIAVALDRGLVLRRIAELQDQAAEQSVRVRSKLQPEASVEEIVGESPCLKRILRQADTVAPTDATVLILGETGVGKELVARAIHDLSPRRGHSFIQFNCAAIPTGLLESELFGHEKGAFTGADAQRLGRLDLAHQGTLFLDEVGDIPLELQPKLLRALQEKEFERLGSTRTIPVDVRLIAATNRDLARMVQAGQFRSDLYYRLKVFPIVVPPLRERCEDIPLLVRYFVQKHAFRMNKRIETIPPEIMEALVQWTWPGNVRELGNFIERAVILTRGSILHVPLNELRNPGQPEGVPAGSLEEVEREHIVKVLRETRGVVGGPWGAAARLGLNRSTLNSRMRKLRIFRNTL